MHGPRLARTPSFTGRLWLLQVKPVVHVEMWPGRTYAQKQELAKAITDAMVRITNTTPEQIATDSIWPFYRLRWQIELIFKVWKSICKIHEVKKVKQHRLECYVYAKLIFIVLGWQILWRIAKVLYHREGKLLSFYKSFKTLLAKALDDIKQAVLEGKSTMENFISTFYGISRRHHLLEKREQQNSPMELLLSLRIN